MHSKVLYNFKSSAVVEEIREHEMGGACNTHEMNNGYKLLVGKPEGKRSSGNLWHRWKHNIKMERNKVRGY
jgi:hypothetical protein